MKKRLESPMSLRVNDEDKAVLAYLEKRLGLKPAQIIRLALRRLADSERAVENK